MAPALLSLSSSAIEANALEHALDASSISFALWPRRPRSAKLGYFIDASEAFPTKSTSSYKLSHHRQPAVASFLQEALTLRHSSTVPGGASFLVELPGNKLRASKHTSFTGNRCAPLASEAGQLDQCCECCSTEDDGGRLKDQGTNLGACKQRCADANSGTTCDERQAKEDSYSECTNQVNGDDEEGFNSCCSCCNDKGDQCKKGCWETSGQKLTCPGQNAENDKYNDAFSTCEGENQDADGSNCCTTCGREHDNESACTKGCEERCRGMLEGGCERWNRQS